MTFSPKSSYVSIFRLLNPLLLRIIARSSLLGLPFLVSPESMARPGLGVPSEGLTNGAVLTRHFSEWEVEETA